MKKSKVFLTVLPLLLMTNVGFAQDTQNEQFLEIFPPLPELVDEPQPTPSNIEATNPTPPILLIPPVPPMPQSEPDGMGDEFYEPPFEENQEEDPIQLIEIPLLNIPAISDEDAATRPALIGRFSLLHKVTGKVEQVFLRRGEPMEFRDMTVIMFDCLSNPPEEVPDTRSFLQIFETRNGVDTKLFGGWMFASSPSIHALDHPVYDLWPLGCTIEDGMTYTGKH